MIEDFGDDGLPLNILGQPKPQQGRFYVAEDKFGKAQKQGLSNEEAGYNDKGKGLRGRKVYPHQSSLPDNYWLVEKDLKEPPNQPFSEEELQGKDGRRFFREYIRLTGKDQRDNQNRSIQGWVRKDTVFEFDIHFINLSKVELGALIWLLSLNDENENRYFHRFGGGKPFGFGSVRLELGENEIFNVNELKKRYLSLDSENEEDNPQPTDAKTFVEAFQKAVLSAYKSAEEISDEQIKKEFEKISFIAAFKRASEGFKNKENQQTNLPVHYPRTSNKPYRPENGENVVNESFRWFVKNNNSEKLPLPDLTADEGLPYFE